MSHENFEDLLKKAQAGDETAMAELVHRYESDVRMVARARLGRALRPHVDSVDLVQSVHKSLMIGLRAEQFDISSPDKLVALATTIVRRKVARKWRKLKRQQRLSGNPSNTVQELSGMLVAVGDSETDPAREVALQEAAERVLESLSDAERSVMELRIEGFTTAEIARQLDLDADVLRVKLSRLRRRLRDRGLMYEFL